MMGPRVNALNLVAVAKCPNASNRLVVVRGSKLHRARLRAFGRFKAGILHVGMARTSEIHYDNRACRLQVGSQAIIDRGHF
jgi:hypothetical protein